MFNIFSTTFLFVCALSQKRAVGNIIKMYARLQFIRVRAISIESVHFTAAASTTLTKTIITT